MSRQKLFIYGVPGTVGGAATKIRDIIRLLRNDYEITVVMSDLKYFKSPEIVTFLRQYEIKACNRRDVPKDLSGSVALGICELDFFVSGTAQEIKRRGMRLVWSNEMMWEFKGEREAVAAGVVDRVLFLSEIQRDAFHDLYKGVDSYLIRNFVTPEDFPFADRSNEVFTIGRLSRPDPVNFSADFPVFYEELGIEDVRFRVQAWSEELKKKYNWHSFSQRWDLLPESKEPASKFLRSLDLFVYTLGYTFVESWGRSTLEAMLTGAIPIVPVGHQFHNMMVHGESGFICKEFREYRDVVQQLYKDAPLRRKISQRAAQYARETICNREEHKRLWKEALTF